MLGKQRFWCEMKQSKRFLKCIDDIGDQGTNIGTWSTVLANKDLLGNVETGSSFSCSKHETLEFTILRGGNKTKSRIMVLNFRRKNSDLFRYPLGRILFFEETRGPGELVDIQVLPSSSSRNFHPCVLEFMQRQQVACTAEQDGLHKTQTQKGRCGSEGREEYGDTSSVQGNS